MRHIEFRGFSKEKQKWVYGDLWSTYAPYDLNIELPAIVNAEGVWPVYSESVGQNLGFKDIKGRDIYEGDEVSAPEHKGADTRVGLISCIHTYGGTSLCFTLHNETAAWVQEEAEVIGPHFYKIKEK